MYAELPFERMLEVKTFKFFLLKTICLVLFFSTSSFFTVSAQQLNFNYLTTEEGLTQNTVLSIIQDSKGLMWFGTGYGLNSYDGCRFRRFINNEKDSTSLSDNDILCLNVDSQNQLWVGTRNGLNHYNAQKQNFNRIKFFGKGSLKVEVRNLIEDNARHLWIATNQGLFLSDINSNKTPISYKLSLPNGFDKADYQSIFQDHKGRFWAGTNRGLISFVFKSKKIENFQTFQKSTDSRSLSNNLISDVVEDKYGQLWVATDGGGLNLYQPQTNDFVRFSYGGQNQLLHNAIRKMMLAADGRIWIGTQEGLSVLNPKTKTFENYKRNSNYKKSLNQNSIYSLYQSKDQSVWVGTYYGGVNVAYANLSKFNVWKDTQGDLGFNVISTILPDGDNYWLGTEGGGLSYVDSHGKVIRRYQNDPLNPQSIGSNLVKIVYQDHDQQIWVGTHGGDLNLLNKKTSEFKRFRIDTLAKLRSKSEITTILEDNQGLFWVASQAGLYCFKREKQALISVALPHQMRSLSAKNIRFLFQDRQSNYWISTKDGLFVFNYSTKMLNQINLNQYLSKINSTIALVHYIYEDSAGNIWLGLIRAGVMMFKPKELTPSKVFTQKDGLANDDILGIVQDNKHQLWFSSADGLTKYNPQNGKFFVYTRADGIAANEFNLRSVAKDERGELFFGGIEGLTYFNPDEIKENKELGNLVFTDLAVAGKKIEIGDQTNILSNSLEYSDKITLNISQNTFTIQFALLNYIKSTKNKYMYQLEGVNKEWIDLDRPEINFANLNSGTYTLLVKGANNDGYWSKPIQIQIEILPPFYKSWWAFLIYFTLLFGIVFLLIRYFYMQKMLVHEDKLHQSKLNFFTNISHEIRTHLTLIAVPIDKMIDETTTNKGINKQLYMVKSHTLRLLNLVTELMDFRKAETAHLKLQLSSNDLVVFLREIKEVFQSIAEKNNIHFELLSDTENLVCCFDKVQMEKVLFNLLSNAFKFTPVKGHITIQLSVSSQQALIKVEDNGRGISVKHLDKLFDNYFQVNDYNVQHTGYGIGLALSKHLVELHQGKLSVKSTTNELDGLNLTTFVIQIPIIQNCIESKQNIKKELAIENYLLEDAAIDVLHEESPLIKSDEKILIVEDNELIRQLLVEILTEKYVVLTAQNGREGLEVAMSEIPDLVLSDVMMPEMSGFELCETLKTDERTNHIPVILLTAKNTLNDELSGLSLGADIYISKPFSRKGLLLNIQNLLKTHALLKEKYKSKFLLEPSQPTLENKDENFLAKLISFIEINMDNEVFTVDVLAEQIGMSYSVLNKKIKALTNLSVNDFSKSIRMKRAAQLVVCKEFNIYEIALLVGFNDSKYFSREFKKQFGVSPSQYPDKSKLENVEP